MKTSTFKKTITANGPNGTFTGIIIATMNYSTKKISGTTAGYHDDYNRTIDIHKVESFIDGEKKQMKEEIQGEQNLLGIYVQMIGSTQLKLNALANQPPVKTFFEKMAALSDNY